MKPKWAERIKCYIKLLETLLIYEVFTWTSLYDYVLESITNCAAQLTGLSISSAMPISISIKYQTKLKTYSTTSAQPLFLPISSFNPSNAEATFIESIMMQSFLKPIKPSHVGIHWITLSEHSQMSNHVPGFQSFFKVLASFCIGKISHQEHKG